MNWERKPEKYTIIILKSFDPLRAKKTFIRKKLGQTMVSAINLCNFEFQRRSYTMTKKI